MHLQTFHSKDGSRETRSHIRYNTFRHHKDTTTNNDAEVVESPTLSQPSAKVQLPPEGVKISMADANGTGLEAFPQIAERVRRRLTDLTTGLNLLPTNTKWPCIGGSTDWNEANNNCKTLLEKKNRKIANS